MHLCWERIQSWKKSCVRQDRFDIDALIDRPLGKENRPVSILKTMT